MKAGRHLLRHDETKGARQLVGAFGERAVEAELIRHGWVPANVNSTVKNSADFDIFAVNSGRTIHIRVKTCGKSEESFQFGFVPNQAIPSLKVSAIDFTVLVKEGTSRDKDKFYVVPSHIVRKELCDRQKDYMAKKKRNGQPRKDIGHWSLRLKGRRDGQFEPGYDIEKRWAKYLDNWEF